MANTYFQCYAHLVFAVKHRECLIHESNRERIQKYICGIVNQDKCKVICIHCYGAFTYSHSQITSVSNYIKKQPEHHKKQTFREEYLHFLEKFGIEYDAQYLFEWMD